MRRPIPDTSMYSDDSAREAHAGWKLRKWVLRIAYRLLQRYGDPKLTRTDSSQAFAKLFLAEFTQPFLQVCIWPSPHPTSACVFLLGVKNFCSARLQVYTCIHLIGDWQSDEQTWFVDKGMGVFVKVYKEVQCYAWS
jgi:hypothetical protein